MRIIDNKMTNDVHLRIMRIILTLRAPPPPLLQESSIAGCILLVLWVEGMVSCPIMRNSKRVWCLMLERSSRAISFQTPTPTPTRNIYGSILIRVEAWTKNVGFSTLGNIIVPNPSFSINQSILLQIEVIYTENLGGWYSRTFSIRRLRLVSISFSLSFTLLCRVASIL